MIKAKDFWHCLCEEFGYRFFAGIPCEGYSFLYDGMSSEFMHYIPAVNEGVALGLVNGAFLAGVKGAIFLPAEKICNLNMSFNIDNNLPLTIITSGKEKPKKIYTVELTEDLKGCLNKITKRNKPSVLFIKGE